jgi:signal peptidase I
MPRWAIALVVVASVLLALLLVSVVGVWVAAGASVPPDAVIVRARNMTPTLLPGDRIIVDRYGDVGPGSIVVFEDPTREGVALMSRVVAFGGQTVDLGKNGGVYVDGKLLTEPYVHGARTQRMDSAITYPVTVPDGSVWVMGDNRPDSADSRYYGPVPVTSIRGVAAVRWWPLARFTRFREGG